MAAEKQERSDDSERGCDKPDGSTTTTTTDTAVAGVSTTSGKCECPVGTEAEFASASTNSVGGTGGTRREGHHLDAGAAAAGTIVAGAVDSTTTTTAPAAVEAAPPSTSVLGESITRPSALARTGAGLGGLALLGGLLCGGGRAAILARRFLRIG